jgi:hypothetical protein
MDEKGVRGIKDVTGLPSVGRLRAPYRSSRSRESRTTSAPHARPPERVYFLAAEAAARERASCSRTVVALLPTRSRR